MGLSDLKFPVAILAAAVIAGGVGFHLIEGVPLGTSFYWTVVTLTTVGYGDIAPVTDAGMAFAAVLMVIGIGAILYAITIIGRNVVEGRVWSLLRGTEKEKIVKKMESHMIVCGFGQIGQVIVEDLLLGNEKVIVIDENEEVLRREAHDVPYLVGDPSHEEVLERAKIRKAKGLFTTLPEDSDNILVALSAKELNPSIRVISRAGDSEGVKHLKRAGAEAVVLPEREGGLRMSRSFLHPEATGLYGYLLQEGGSGVGAVRARRGSRMVGGTIRKIGIRENIGASVVAIKRGKEIIANPKPNQKINAGDTLIALGTDAQIERLGKLAKKAK